jgi:hypothetical protein
MPARKKLLQKEKVPETQKHGTDGEPARAPLEKSLVSTGIDLGLCRARILEKYWELANLHPEVTKGNIAGQLKALDSLCQALDVVLTEKAQPDDKMDKGNGIYRSAWMHSDKTTDATNDE